MVFKTSVESAQHVHLLGPFLDSVAGRGHWNFALDDQDKILRIASSKVSAEAAIQLLRQNGFECNELSD